MAAPILKLLFELLNNSVKNSYYFEFKCDGNVDQKHRICHVYRLTN